MELEIATWVEKFASSHVIGGFDIHEDELSLQSVLFQCNAVYLIPVAFSSAPWFESQEKRLHDCASVLHQLCLAQ